MIMKNPAIEIKKWLISQLQAYSYIDVYDAMVPDIVANEYIVVTARTASPVDNKTGYTHEISANVDIVTKTDSFGFKRGEQLADMIMAGINSDTNVVLPAGWDCKNVVVASINNLEDLDPFGNTFRVIIRYTFVITQTI